MPYIPGNITIGTAAGNFDTAAEARAAIEQLDRLGLVLVERHYCNRQHVLYWEQA